MDNLTPHEQALLEQYNDYLAYQGAQGEDETDFYDDDQSFSQDSSPNKDQ
ncbi:hypothetical protein [Helicobacter suis]|uniref:Uncharacterized protein n=1 Tax=Helicobacter suis TaxID=104628 RepID=A0A510HF44_9HELI|nr:hypothetical protein [Helicobacter suis]BCD70386.1 hypothetical protein SNTW_10310 [Helicobacter suis]BCD71045.1 hypothetical protein SNTW_16900 [Helicobacter suis]